MKCIILSIVFLVVCNVFATAQVCTGSLGDPVVEITFGEGSNPGPPLPGGSTTYKYSRSSCPNQEEYSLVNLTFSCFSNSWHTLSGDHTPQDGGGYYMLINAGSTVGDFFKYTIQGLCPNTNYEIAAWVKNVLRPTACNGNGVDPNLTFTIENTAGTVLATYNSGDISEEEDPTWRQFGFLFKTPAVPDNLVLRIKNTAISGCGNAFALDDITVRPCGPLISATVTSNGKTAADVCDGDKTTFILSSSYGPGFSNPVFQWQKLEEGSSGWQDIPGANSPTYTRTPTGAGAYFYRMLVGESGNFFIPSCRIPSNQVSINVMHPPFVQATNYVYGCLGGDVTLFASGATYYQWTGPNGFTSSSQQFVLPSVQYINAGLYKVTGTNDIGCINSDSTILKVYPNVTATSSAGTYICEGTSTQLVAGGGFRYQWDPPTGLSSDTSATPLASPTENTMYKVTVTGQFGCSDTGYIKINVWKKPVADAGPDRKTRIGIPITLKGIIKGTDVSWYWSPGNGLLATQQLTPEVNPPQTTSYRLNVVSPHGCATSTDEVIVKVYEKIIIPNAFSPNGDGINDTWFIDPLYLFEDAVTEVYNRYGQVVYRSKGYSTPWNGTSNGKPVPIGTYYYVIDLKVNREPRLIGSLTILR